MIELVLLRLATLYRIGYIRHVCSGLSRWRVRSLCIGSARPNAISSLSRLLCKADVGYALGLAQLGGKHPNSKPWKGEGPGVFEIVENFDGNTYRAVYTVRFEGAIYVLHAFQKKSPSGIRTAAPDVELIGERLRRAGEDYESR